MNFSKRKKPLVAEVDRLWPGKPNSPEIGYHHHRSSQLARRSIANGYTLLEVILTIALSVVVMMLVGVALDGYYQLVSGGREKVEEAQLARALLHQIADDLRSTVRYETLDMSSVVALLPGGEDLSDDLDNIDDELGDELGGGLGGDVGAGLGGALGGTAGETEENQADDEPEPIEDIAQGFVPPDRPGLYGNATEILIDVSRLPRVDEYELMLLNEASGSVQDVPSDVKSVAYYVSSASSSPAAATSITSPGFQVASGGLVRRSLDRAVTVWAAENGNTDDLEKSAQVLAPEVTAIRFRYFDGTDWLDQWNSEASGGIPLAVEISLTLTSTPRRSVASRAITSISAGDEQLVESRYLHIVHLPAAELTDADSSQAADEETDAGASR